MIENVIYCNCTIDNLNKILRNVFKDVTQINDNEIILFGQINLNLETSTKQIKITTHKYKEETNQDIDSNICLQTILNDLLILILSIDSTLDSNLNTKIDVYNREIDAIKLLFKEQFGEQLQPISEQDSIMTIVVGKNSAKIDINKLTIIDCKSVPLRGRIDSILQIANKLNKNMP